MTCISDTKQTIALENKAMEEQKITIEQLMDKAGKALADVVLNEKPKGLVLIVCGKGNNGGDGFVAARYLVEKKIEVKVMFLYDPDELGGDSLNAFKKLPNNILVSAEDEKVFAQADVIVDAIFGFSFRPPLRDYEAGIIDSINAQNASVISADVPSGLDATTGEAEEGKVVNASKTICFSCYKKGLFTNKGPLYAGKPIVVDIGISPAISDRYKLAIAIEEKDALRLLPKRSELAHKKSVGRVLVVSGSQEYTGAPIMTSEAAYRTGTGYVTLLVPQFIKELVQQKITPEVIIRGLKSSKEGSIAKVEADRVAEFSKDYDCLAIGPGLGANDETFGFVKSLLEKIQIPAVVDADAITAIADDVSILKQINTQVVLTPHSAELATLTGMSVSEIEVDRFAAVEKLANKNITVVLKGRYSIIARENDTKVNLNSNPGMATAGTGDVLTGVIASLISQGLSTENAAQLGVFLHGLAGDIAAKELSQYSIMATDIIDCIPYAYIAIDSEEDVGNCNCE